MSCHKVDLHTLKRVDNEGAERTFTTDRFLA